MSVEAVQDIDAEAARLGVTRSEVARRLLVGPKLARGVVDLDETLMLLSEQARSGVVSAQTALLRYHTQRREPQPAPEPDPFDQAAERSLRVVGGEPAA